MLHGLALRLRESIHRIVVCQREELHPARVRERNELRGLQRSVGRRGMRVKIGFHLKALRSACDSFILGHRQKSGREALSPFWILGKVIRYGFHLLPRRLKFPLSAPI